MAAVSVPAASAAPTHPHADRRADGSDPVVFDAGVTGTVARQLVTAAGGTVASDLTDQIGVVVATSAVPGFDATLRASGLVEDAAENLRFQGLPATQSKPGDPPPVAPGAGRASRSSARSGTCSRSAPRRPTPQPAAAWMSASSTAASTATTRLPRQRPALERRLRRGADFTAEARASASRWRASTTIPRHARGRHRSRARRNGIGVVGVAPNATLIPIKVCDADGHCYVSDAVEGITYAGDLGSTSQHELLRRRRRFPGVDRVQVPERPDQRAYRMRSSARSPTRVARA